MPLSQREQQILAEIERADPELPAALSTADKEARSEQWRYPLSIVDTLLLVLLPVVLVLAYPLGAALGTAGVGLLTAGLVLPWLVRATRPRPDRGGAPWASG